MATEREVDRWRSKAEDNMALTQRLLTAVLWAAKQIVALTDMHVPDDFSHCQVCKTEWPCPTATEVRELSEVFDRATSAVEATNGKG